MSGYIFSMISIIIENILLNIDSYYRQNRLFICNQQYFVLLINTFVDYK